MFVGILVVSGMVDSLRLMFSVVYTLTCGKNCGIETYRELSEFFQFDQFSSMAFWLQLLESGTFEQWLNFLQIGIMLYF